MGNVNLVPRGRDPFGQRRGSGSRFFQRMTKGTPGDEVVGNVWSLRVLGKRALFGKFFLIQWTPPRGGGRTPNMKGVGMVVVSLRSVKLRGVNFGFWSHLGCSGQNAFIFSREGTIQGNPPSALCRDRWSLSLGMFALENSPKSAQNMAKKSVK